MKKNILFLHYKVGGWTWIWEWANNLSLQEYPVEVVQLFPKFLTRKTRNLDKASNQIAKNLQKNPSFVSFTRLPRIYLSSIFRTLVTVALIKTFRRKHFSSWIIFDLPIGRVLASNIALQQGTFDFPLRDIKLFHLIQMLFIFFNSFDKSRRFLAREDQSKSYVVITNGRDLSSSAIYLSARSLGFSTSILELNSYTDTIICFENSPHSVKEYWAQLAQVDTSKQPISTTSTYFDQRLSRDSRFLIFSPKVSDQDRIREVQNFCKGRQFVTFFSHSEHEVPVLEEWQDNSSEYLSQFDAVRSLAQECVKRNLVLVVRRHPNSVGFNDKVDREQEAWREVTCHPDILYFEPSASIDSYTLAKMSFAVLTHQSTIGIECAYMGVPSRAMGPAFWAYSAQSRVWSLENLQRFLDQPTTLSRDICTAWAVRETTPGYSFSLFQKHEGRYARYGLIEIGEVKIN